MKDTSARAPADWLLEQSRDARIKLGSKDLSQHFQTSYEINFLISIEKSLPTSGKTSDVASKNFSPVN